VAYIKVLSFHLPENCEKTSIRIDGMAVCGGT